MSAFMLRYGSRGLAEQNPAIRPDGEPPPPLTVLEKPLLGRVVHEHDHLYRFLYTTYGFLHHRLRCASVQSFFAALKEALPDLDGSQTPLVYRESTQPVIDALAGRQAPVDSEALRRVLIEQAGLQIVGDLDSGPEVRGRPLGASAILEALAFNREITIARFAGATNEEWSAMLDSSRPGVLDYTHAQVAWRAGLSHPLVPPPKSRTTWTAVGGTPKRPALPLEFYLACELALWIPLAPPGDESRMLHWMDLHPGWRFLRVLEYLEDERVEFVSHDDFPGSFEARYEELQSEICDAIGWPRPRELAQAWENWLAGAWERRTTGGYFLEGDSARLQAGGQLLATWRREPCNFSLGLSDFGGRSQLWFSALEVGDGQLLNSAPPHQPIVPNPYAWFHAERLVGAGDKGGRYFRDDAALISAAAALAERHYGITESAFQRYARTRVASLR
ncbi:MAG: hypothetical protein IT349_09070 [Candidatus Eisenbacteria bacterium]|nr:hypothetical protein [Candidatus Eisenbacteria bacterium]